MGNIERIVIFVTTRRWVLPLLLLLYAAVMIALVITPTPPEAP